VTRLPGALALGAILLLACDRGEAAAGANRAVAVRVARAVERDVPVEIRAVGKVVASQSVAVRPQVSGTLVSARFAEGATVRKGDLLLEIDRRPYQAALAEARAELAEDRARAANAREDARRYADLAEREFVTRQQAETARANAAALEAAVLAGEAAVERAALDLSYCTIRAPIAGRTGRLLVHPGNLVSANAPEPLVTIEQLRPVHAQFAVPERHLAALRARRDPPPSVRIRATAGGAEVVGALDFVDNAVDPATGTILLRASFANEDETLWPGQVVEIAVRVAERARAVVVPAAAVATGQRGEYAYVVTAENRAELRPVVVDQVGTAETVVSEGISAGEVVVTEGHVRLRPGAAVEVLPERAPGS
jgi:multidrug efflux system membrane fusion protein